MKMNIKTRTGLTTIRLEHISAITEIDADMGDIHMISGTIFQCVENIDGVLHEWECL